MIRSLSDAFLYARYTGYTGYTGMCLSTIMSSACAVHAVRILYRIRNACDWRISMTLTSEARYRSGPSPSSSVHVAVPVVTHVCLPCICAYRCAKCALSRDRHASAQRRASGQQNVQADVAQPLGGFSQMLQRHGSRCKVCGMWLPRPHVLPGRPQISGPSAMP